MAVNRYYGTMADSYVSDFAIWLRRKLANLCYAISFTTPEIDVEDSQEPPQFSHVDLISLDSSPQLTKDFSIDVPETFVSNQAPKKTLLEEIMAVIKDFKIGGDLLSLELPPQLLMPKSELQLSGESIYGLRVDLMSACGRGRTEEERLVAVVAWYLTTVRIASLSSPYKPFLGETHHVTNGNLNVLLEQVAHDPPTTAIHVSSQSEGVIMTEWHATETKFHGTWLEVELKGQNKLYLEKFGESYESTFPKLGVRFLPFLLTDWYGPVRIFCSQTGLQADLNYESKPFFATDAHENKISGSISDAKSGEILYKVSGNWNSKTVIKDVRNGTSRQLYDFSDVLLPSTNFETVNPSELAVMESCRLWSELTSAIESCNWMAARKAQVAMESTRREHEGGRGDSTFIPQYFTKTIDGRWIWKGTTSKYVPEASLKVKL